MSPRPPSARCLALRRRFLLGVWMLAGALLGIRAVELQVTQAAEWQAEADRQHRMQGEVAAPRGSILDRGGVPLALSHETFRVSLAPHELRDPAETRALLASVLGLSEEEAGRVVSSERRWIPLPGRFPPSVREQLRAARGVYVERELRRFHPRGPLARAVLGDVIDGQGAGGVEQAFDEHLQGTPGTETLARDSEGRAIPGETWLLAPSRSGGDVVLTLDWDLQEIAHEALRDAVETTQARGGDLLVTDPRTGEILAMASRSENGAAGLGSINTPYEPGSTLKPFTVAALLNHGKASMGDSVDTGEGRWSSQGRTITDVYPVGTVTLAEALQVSSNVGVAKAAGALAPSEQYEMLRDFGFGVPSGIQLTGETGGTLRHPARWSRQSAASLAIGYEIAVTPIQMAMAYGALANGGVLMEPRMIRELRDSEGEVIRSFEPRGVRRVVSEETAAEVNRALVQAVEEGTGTRAGLASFAVAGKSGTSRAHVSGGGYETGAYYSSFVGYFPAEDPQLVVFVKLDRPQGAYYGGATAAPVTRATMEAILAARRPPLDRHALATIARSQRIVPPPLTSPREPAQRVFTSAEVAPIAPTATFAAHSGPTEPSASQTARSGQPGVEVAVPDVRGLAPRVAARRLHAMGLSVIWEAPGAVSGSTPEVGSLVVPGDTIRLVSGPPGHGPPSPSGSSGDG